jgi:hypothetical protein
LLAVHGLARHYPAVLWAAILALHYKPLPRITLLRAAVYFWPCPPFRWLPLNSVGMLAVIYCALPYCSLRSNALQFWLCAPFSLRYIGCQCPAVLCSTGLALHCWAMPCPLRLAPALLAIHSSRRTWNLPKLPVQDFGLPGRCSQSPSTKPLSSTRLHTCSALMTLDRNSISSFALHFG